MKTYIKRAGQWFLDRFKEPSTWLGLVSFFTTVLGVSIDPGNAATIATTGATVASGLLVALSQTKAEASK